MNAETDLTGPGANTRLHYKYRDVSNCQVVRTVVLAGRISHEQVGLMVAAMIDTECFIPGQVGLVDLQGELARWDGDDNDPAFRSGDHPFHTIEEIAYTDDDADDLSVEALVRVWPRSADDWDAAIAEDRLVVDPPKF